jgi:competence protein ComEC
MQYRHLFPMVRILLPFMAGIIVCLVITATAIIPVSIWMTILLLTIGSGFIPSITRKTSKKWLFGTLLSIFLFICGYNSVILHKEILRPGHFSKTQNQGLFIATVCEPLQEKDHSFKTILEVRGIQKGNLFIKAEGRILTYFAKDSVNKPPSEGSLIVFSSKVQEISLPQNPGSFDYRKYMASSNVYHQVYLDNSSWKTLENPHGFNLIRFAHQVSNKFVDILRHNGLKGREFAVASALIMGQSNMLDNETLQAYSGTGVMHILSVSGLHVGVIFIIISFLLRFIKKKGAQLYLKTAIILFTIWAYALLTGMSPSVMRSAAMFTFISLGNASNRYVHIINSLGVSALALLLYDPLMISNIGFQLSYIAIIGIVFINKPLADLWDPKNRVAGYIWDLIAVSIAAQIATAPLAMMYFHQFPVYFIPANLVAIPLSFLAIYSGVAVLATALIPVISNFFGIITNYLLFALNISVGFIEQLPHSVLHVTSIFSRETILIYVGLIFFILFLYFNRKQLFYITLAMVLLLTVSFSFTEITRQKQQKIIFYSAGKQTAIGIINGKQQTLLADSMLINDKIAIKFQLDGSRSLFGIAKVNSIALDTTNEIGPEIKKEFNHVYISGNYLLYKNKRIAIIDSIPKTAGDCAKLKIDYLVIRHNPKLQIKDLQKLYESGLIIIDGSNSIYKTDKWLAECEKAGLKAYSVKDNGAYIVDL